MGVERGCSAHVAKPDSCHPKNSKRHHPSLALAAVLASLGTNCTRAGVIGANIGLAGTAFGSAALARGSKPLGGALLPQQGDKRTQSLPCPGAPTSGTATLSTSFFFVDLPPGTSESRRNTDLHL